MLETPEMTSVVEILYKGTLVSLVMAWASLVLPQLGRLVFETVEEEEGDDSDSDEAVDTLFHTIFLE